MDRFGESPQSNPSPSPEATAGAAGILGGDDALGRSLERWTADAMVDEAARTRVRARWLRVQADESASLVGTMIDLAERRTPVVFDVGEHRFRGILVGIGGDFVAVRTDRGQDVIVRTETIDVIRAEPGGVDVRGDRAALLDVELADVLGPVAADRPDVLVRTRTSVTARGELRSAGTDVIRLRVDGDPPTPTWIPTASIAILVIDP